MGNFSFTAVNIELNFCPRRAAEDPPDIPVPAAAASDIASEVGSEFEDR